MRYYSRSNQFRASHVVFDVNKMTAHSYGWWLFFSIINGTNVFNPYHYSISTSGHQRKVRELLHNLGIPIDLEIQSPEGLDDLTGAYEDCSIEDLVELCLVVEAFNLYVKNWCNSVPEMWEDEKKFRMEQFQEDYPNPNLRDFEKVQVQS